ncbi:hypothetical protein EES41_04910 [Streptomyces sp. ADI95-16]|nr:hypothetical protein EES41_04910 [Streptomyces sp. ADI95-16]
MGSAEGPERRGRAGTVPSRPARGDAGGRRGPAPPSADHAVGGHPHGPAPAPRRPSPSVPLQAALATDAVPTAPLRTPHADEARQSFTSGRSNRLPAPYELGPPQRLPQGELFGLQWNGVDLSAGTASIRRTLQRTQNGGLMTLPIKTRSSGRRIALPTEGVHPLKGRRDGQEAEREAVEEGWRGGGLGFTAPAEGASDPPTSIAASAPSSIGPGSAASASATYGTPPPPCFWNKASNSSCQRAPPVSPPPSTPTSDAGSRGTPPTSWAAPSGAPTRPPGNPTTLTNRHSVQHRSASVAVNYCCQTVQRMPEAPP